MPEMNWKEIAFSPKVIKRAFKTSLVVGTILLCINQGDLIYHHHFHASSYWKIPLTYLVPYLVTTWGALTVMD